MNKRYNFLFPGHIVTRFELLVQESGMNRTAYIISLINRETKELEEKQIKQRKPKENSI